MNTKSIEKWYALTQFDKSSPTLEIEIDDKFVDCVDVIGFLITENRELRAGLLRDDARHPEGCKCGVAGCSDDVVPGHQGCCDICNAGGCCKSDDTESEADNG
jgi:hypothetical protein